MFLVRKTRLITKGKKSVIFKVLLLFGFFHSCQTVPVGSVVERSKYEAPSWKKNRSQIISSNTNKIECVGFYTSDDDLPKVIKEAQLSARNACGQLVSQKFLQLDSRLSRKYTSRDLEKYFKSCTGKCVELSDIYYEKIAESDNLFSYRVYVKLAYKALIK